MEMIRGAVPDWANGDGSGDGSGYGYGYGSGYGYGYCYGDGDGSGDGSGYGYGDGSGDGSGYGYGYGSGYGYCYGSYWKSAIPAFAAKWPAHIQARLATLQSNGATVAYWRSDETGRPANGGKADPVTPGIIQREKGPLKLCAKGTLHATLLPPKWKGERWWIVALIGDVVGDDEKMGALEREIIGECL